jgi:hypothetical protein
MLNENKRNSKEGGFAGAVSCWKMRGADCDMRRRSVSTSRLRRQPQTLAPSKRMSRNVPTATFIQSNSHC